MNVLHFILGTPCILRFLDRISEEEKEAQEQQGDNDFVAADLVTYEADPETGDVVIDASTWENKKEQAKSAVFPFWQIKWELMISRWK